MSKITEAFVESALRHGVIIKTSSVKNAAPENVTYAAVIEMANLGFKVDPNSLKDMSEKSLTQMINKARKIVGADRNMIPVYPGFPKQVQELSTITLFVEQLMHYWSHGVLLPDYPDVTRNGIALADIARSARETKVMTAKKAAEYFIENLTKNTIALSNDDRELLKGSVDLLSPSISEVAEIIAKSKNSENIQALVLAANDVLKKTHSVNEMIQEWVPSVRTVDGVLRIVLAVSTDVVSDGRRNDYVKAVYNLMDSKTNSIRMMNLSRPSRRVVMQHLSKLSQGFNADYIVAHRNLWRRIMRMIHPYSLSLDDNAKRISDIIHENIEYKTFNSLVEEALAEKNVEKVVELLGENQPGNLLRRIVSILRMCDNKNDAKILSDSVEKNCGKSKLTTLISAYNGVLSTNDSHARLTRVAGLNNTLVEKEIQEVNPLYVSMLISSLSNVIKENLSKNTDSPNGVVGTVSNENVPLVRRDLATTDREMNRGEVLSLAGDGDTVRLFNHWNNNQDGSGYMDTGAVILNNDFETKSVITWDSWARGRSWSTYSGDKLVYPGDNAVEYIDVDMKKLKESIPDAKWIAMTIQSWSGFVTKDVDVIAGVMLRSEPDSGEVFDPRTLTTAFKPTSESLQSVPLVINIETGEMIWIDSSSGSTESGVSAKNDDSVGTVVYDEIERPRLTMGELAEMWAEAHGAETDSTKKVDKKEVMDLL